MKDPLEQRAQLYTDRAGELRPAGSPLRGADDFPLTYALLQIIQWTLRFPCAGKSGYPFAHLPSEIVL